jgi:hypothetical protein
MNACRTVCRQGPYSKGLLIDPVTGKEFMLRGAAEISSMAGTSLAIGTNFAPTASLRRSGKGDACVALMMLGPRIGMTLHSPRRRTTIGPCGHVVLFPIEVSV